MKDTTDILSRIEQGDPSVSEQLLPLVYAELRRLAAVRMANERSDHALNATALVHEAYLRLVDTEQVQQWSSRGHFFAAAAAAAAEAMRRILVESARRRKRIKHGGQLDRQSFDEAAAISLPAPLDELIAVDEALEREDPDTARLVMLRFFGGFSMSEVADVQTGQPSAGYRRLESLAR